MLYIQEGSAVEGKVVSCLDNGPSKLMGRTKRQIYVVLKERDPIVILDCIEFLACPLVTTGTASNFWSQKKCHQ